MHKKNQIKQGKEGVEMGTSVHSYQPSNEVNQEHGGEHHQVG